MELTITDEAKEQLEKQFGGKTIRIKPKHKTWGGSSYELVQDELLENDNFYDMGLYKFIIDKEEEKDAPFIEIDYQKYHWGEEFVVTTFC